MLLFRLTTTRIQQCGHVLTQRRCISKAYDAYNAALSQLEDPQPGFQINTFESLGLRPSVIKALRKAFPSVVEPTEAQTQLIPAVLGDQDVLVLDDTGTGKSFGLVLSLLNKPRLRYKDEQGKPRDKLSITSLYIVPHKDLANQIYIWIKTMAEAASAHESPKMSAVAQVLVRDGTKHTTSGLAALKADPPHILITTPQALSDVCNEDPDAVRFQELSTVVVDEVDYLVETTPRTVEWKSEKLRKKHQKTRHIGVTTQMLSMIYESRINSWEHKDTTFIDTRDTPQLIVASATVRRGLRSHLFYESGLMQKTQTTVIYGPDYHKNVASRGLGGVGIQHSVVLVRDNQYKNIPEAAPGPPLTPPETLSTEEVLNVSVNEEQYYRYVDTPSPFDLQVLEAVATAFAVDVPSVALVVLGASSPVHRAVYDLRSIGVNAIAMDITDMSKGGAHLMNRGAASDAKFKANPVLLVCTRATARGIDLPELTHVFILDMFGEPMTGQLVDEYVHIAGRVGRFGRGGKVVTFVNDNQQLKNALASDRQVPRIRKVLDDIGASAVRFEVFD